MPEGPSLIIVKEKIKQFEGQKILSATGYAEMDFARLKNKKIIEIRTWGKHLFICSAKVIIEIHLRMFGSYTINETKKINPKISLQFADSFLNFYVVDVKLIDNLEAFDPAADVMSNNWDPDAALRKIRELPEAMICDVLLMQPIFSGVGNIIKNEVLWRVKMHPAEITKNISAQKLRSLMKETVKYSFEFLEQRKAGTLSRNWKVYKQQYCARCGGEITKTATGKMKRGSFWCAKCQKIKINTKSK